MCLMPGTARGVHGTGRMGSAPACEPGRIAAGQVARVWRAPRRTAEDVEDVRREVQIMHHLEGHANIVKIFGAYEDKHSVHLARCAAPARVSLLRLRMRCGSGRIGLRQTKDLHAGARARAPSRARKNETRLLR